MKAHCQLLAIDSGHPEGADSVFVETLNEKATDLAEAEPMPHILQPMRWAQVKRFFEKEVAAVAKGVL